MEEMPPFPERESSILAKLKKKKGPSTVTDLEDTKKEKNSSDVNGGTEPAPVSTAVCHYLVRFMHILTFCCNIEFQLV